MRNYKRKHFKMWKTEEVTKYSENKMVRPLLHKINVQLHTDSNDMSIHRVLGHIDRMPGCGRWRMETQQGDNCWVCDRWMYTLYFWNQEIGCFNDVNNIGIDKETKVSLVEKIRLHNPESYLASEDVPVLFSNITNWRPRPFITLMDFLDSLEEGAEPDYEKTTMADA